MPRGSVLTYYVTLSNTSQTAYPLNPCPNYTEYVGGGKVDYSDFQLNCASVQQIAPGASVVFQMQLAVPATTTLGSNTLTWRLNDGRVSFDLARVAIQITG